MISVHGVITASIGPRINIACGSESAGFWQNITFFDQYGDKESIKIFFADEGTPLPVTAQPVTAEIQGDE